MKHILFIMTDLCGGGAEKALVELLKSFDYSRFKVSLCLLFYRGIYLDEIPKQVRVIHLFKSENDYFHRKAFRKYKKYNQSKYLTFYMRWKVRGHYDVIISFLEGQTVLYHSFIMNRANKNISWVHCDLLNYHFSYNYFYQYAQEEECYKRMDKIFFVSEVAMANFNRLYDIKVPKCCVHNIINSKEIEVLSGEESTSKSCFTITSIGSLIEVKGFERLIRVANMLKSDGYLFSVQIIGIGEKENELKKLCDELGLHDTVCFLGFKKPSYPFLKHSDIFVSTSFSEGFSLVICEALALGIPVVATKTAGAIELLGDSVYGIITGHEDLSIYQGIKKMMDDECLRQDYAVKGKKRVESFGPKEVMANFYRLISCL